MNDIPQMQTCACGDGCEYRASVKWRGYLVVDCVPDQEAGRLIAAITEGMADAVAEERAAVVAWLREEYDTHSTQDAADHIERGEHRREEER
jgi:hypothetical protein